MGNCSSAPRLKALNVNLRAFIAANPPTEGYGDEWYFDTMNVLLDRWAYSHVQFLRKKFLEATSEKGEKEVDKKGFFKLFGQLQDMPKAVAESAFRMFDTDNSGKLNFREFCCALALCCHLMSSDDEKIRFVFDMFDTNDDGLLSSNDVQLLLESIRDDEMRRNEDGKAPGQRQLRINEMKQELLGNAQCLTFEHFHEWASRNLDSLNSLLHTFQIVPSPERERLMCEEILSRHQSLQEGSTWYCISHKWLQVWKAHACWKGPSPGRRLTSSSGPLPTTSIRDRGISGGSEFDLFDDDGSEEPLGILNSEGCINHMSARPPEIDNSDLEGEHKGELKMNLVEHLDYELIPEDMWLRLVEWYGGGPAIPRKVICMGQDHQPQVELYPPLVLVVVAGESGQSLPQFSRRFFISRQSSLEEVLHMLAEKLARPGDKSRLWHRATGDRWRLVQQMTLTLEEFLEGKVRDAGAFLLETQRPNGEWPRDDALAASAADGSSELDREVQRHFEVGDRIEARSGVTSQWMRGTIVDVIQRDHSSAPSQVKVHYDSTVYKSDEWISTSSDRLAPLETFTSGTSSSSAAVPAPAESASAAADSPPIRGATGLQNLGNTCFLNATIQCMANTPLLREYFLSTQYTKDINERGAGCKGRLAEEFGQVMVDLWGGKSTALTPRNLKRTIDQFAPQFAGYEQHDAQEFLAFFLDGLHEDLNRSTLGTGTGSRAGTVCRREAGTPKLFSNSRRDLRAGAQLARAGSREVSPKRQKPPHPASAPSANLGAATTPRTVSLADVQPLQDGSIATDDDTVRSSEAVDPSQFDENIEQIGWGSENIMPADEAGRMQQRIVHPTMLWSRPRPEEGSSDKGSKPLHGQAPSRMAWVKQPGEAMSMEDAVMSTEKRLPSNPKVSQPGLGHQGGMGMPHSNTAPSHGGLADAEQEQDTLLEPPLGFIAEAAPDQDASIGGALEHRAIGFRQPPPASAIASTDFDVTPQMTALAPVVEPSVSLEEGLSTPPSSSAVANSDHDPAPRREPHFPAPAPDSTVEDGSDESADAVVVQPPPSIGGGGGGGVGGILAAQPDDSDESRRPGTADSIWSTTAMSDVSIAATKAALPALSSMTAAGAAVAAVFGVAAGSFGMAPTTGMQATSTPVPAASPSPFAPGQGAGGRTDSARRSDLDKKGPGTSRWWSFAWRRGRGALDLPKDMHAEHVAHDMEKALHKDAMSVASVSASTAGGNGPSAAGSSVDGTAPGRETMALLDDDHRPKLPAGAAAAAVASVSASRAASEVGEDGPGVHYALNETEDFVPELLTPQTPAYKRSLSLFTLSWRRKKPEDVLATPKRRPRTPPAMMPLQEESAATGLVEQAASSTAGVCPRSEGQSQSREVADEAVGGSVTTAATLGVAKSDASSNNHGNERPRSRDGGRAGRTKEKESSWPMLWRRSKSRENSSSTRQRTAGLRPLPMPVRGAASGTHDAGGSSAGGSGSDASKDPGTGGPAGLPDAAAQSEPRGDAAAAPAAAAEAGSSTANSQVAGGSVSNTTSLGFPFLRSVPWKRGGDSARGPSPAKAQRPEASRCRTTEDFPLEYPPECPGDDNLVYDGTEAMPAPGAPAGASGCDGDHASAKELGQEETEHSDDNADEEKETEVDEDNLPDNEKAARQWERYRAQNRSLVVDIFEGQLRSQLTCCQCGCSSSTFEPFRYLSVPIPSNHVDRAVLRIVLFALPFARGDERPQLMRYSVAVPKSSTVQRVEKALSRVLPIPMTSVLLAEVYRSRIHRYLDSSLSLNDVRSEDQLFAFEVLQTPDELTQYQERHTVAVRPPVRRDKPEVDGRKPPQPRVLLIQAMHRRVVDVCRSDGRTWAQRREVFGLPFVMSAASSWTYATLHDMLMFHARRFLKTPRRDALRHDTSLLDERPGAQAQMPFVARIVNASGTGCGACDRRNCTGCLLPKGNARLRLRAGLLQGTVSTAKIYLALDWVDSTAYDQDYVDSVADDLSVSQPLLDRTVSNDTEEPDGDTSSLNGGAHQRENSRSHSQAPVTVPISACIDAFAEPEELKTELGNGVRCEKCNEVVDAVKKLEIWREPDVLLIHIKRFRFSGVHYEKLNTSIEVPCRDLNLRPWIVGPSGASSTPYELYAAACHRGGMSGGHYTSFAVNNEGKEPTWLKFNDEAVSSVSLGQELDEISKQCYVLFYRKRAFSSSNLINYSSLV